MKYNEKRYQIVNDIYVHEIESLSKTSDDVADQPQILVEF